MLLRAAWGVKLPEARLDADCGVDSVEGCGKLWISSYCTAGNPSPSARSMAFTVCGRAFSGVPCQVPERCSTQLRMLR